MSRPCFSGCSLLSLLLIAKSWFICRACFVRVQMYKHASVQVFLNDVCFFYQSHAGMLPSFPDLPFFFFFFLRGVILFRPPQLSNKFEDSSVLYDEGKFTNAKIKKFIQDNM